MVMGSAYGIRSGLSMAVRCCSPRAQFLTFCSLCIVLLRCKSPALLHRATSLQDAEGGLNLSRSLVFVLVHVVLETSVFCSLRVVIFVDVRRR